MIEANHWKEGSRHQWIYYAKDNSSLEGLSEKINPDEILCSSETDFVNLGIKRINGRLYSGNNVGICRLKNMSGKTLLSKDGREVILKVEPRFPVSVVEMLNALREDDEFERYLAPQTNKLSETIREIEDLSENELFHFFDDEDPVFLQDEIAKESSIITASVYITLLKNLCNRPLMGRMVCEEENLVGKAKGKIVFLKNIRNNTIKGRDDRIFCRYLHYSEDILENRVLKSALHKAELFLNQYFGSTSGENNSFRSMISFNRKALSHVSYTKITRMDLSKIKTTGVYVYYKPVINAAKMVLNEITLEANGKSSVTSYVVPYSISMDKLFEVYVRAYFKRAGVHPSDSKYDGIQISKYDYKIPVFKESNGDIANYIKGNIKPDIIIYNPLTKKYVVFDVKYKDSSSSRYSRPDRMQILAYGLMMDCVNIGNIFPSHDGTGNVYYECNEINSNETRVRFYNQLELAIDTNWKFEVTRKDQKTKMSILEYLEQLMV